MVTMKEDLLLKYQMKQPLLHLRLLLLCQRRGWSYAVSSSLAFHHLATIARCCGICGEGSKYQDSDRFAALVAHSECTIQVWDR
jgi:hypothetical protein